MVCEVVKGSRRTFQEVTLLKTLLMRETACYSGMAVIVHDVLILFRVLLGGPQ